MNTDPRFNPWIAPAVKSPDAEATALGSSDLLPVEFQTPLLTRVAMLPIGILMSMVTISACFSAVGYLDDAMKIPVALALLGIAFITGGAAYGCLLPMRCKVVLTETSIHKTEFFREVIEYGKIKSWHHHPATGTVYVRLSDETDYVAISNWAMSREKSEILGRVLHDVVGPPRG